MKKVLVIILILVVVVIGIGVILQITEEPVAVEDILPEGLVGYIRMTDLGKNIDSFKATRFWKGIAGIDYERVLEQTGASDETMAVYDNFKKNLPSPATQALLKKFLGEEVVVAVYPTSFEDFSSENLLKMASDVFFVTRLKPETQFAEFFATLFSSFQRQVSTQDVPYRNHTIHVVSTNDGRIRIGYVRIKDVLVFGVGEKGARACLDVFDKEKKPLSGDRLYLETHPSFLEGAHFTGYLDFKFLKKQLLQWATQNQEDPQLIQKQLEENLKQVKGFTAMSYSGVFAEVSQFKTGVHFDRSDLSPDVLPLYDCSPKENRTFSFVPSGVLGYQWSTCYDLAHYWKQVQKEMQKGDSVPGTAIPSREMIAGIEGKMNLSIEDDILPALGDEVGGFLTDIDTNGIFPVPKLIFFIKVTSREKAAKVIKTLIGQQTFVRPQEEKHGSATIQYVTIPLVANLQPAYAFVDDYLLITTDRQLLKDSLDTFKAQPSKSLIANQGFQDVNFGLTDKNNSVFFLQSEELMNKAQVVMDWANQWALMQVSKQDAFKKGSQRRLLDVRRDIESQKKELQELRTELGTIEKTLQDESGTEVSSIGDMVKQIKEKEQGIQSSQEAVGELEEIIKGYDAKMVGSTARQVLVNELVKPLLKAFASVKAFASKVVFGEGILETFIYLKME